MSFNKILLVINLLLIQAYLIRFKLWTYPTNLQEILIGLNFLMFLYATPLRQILRNLKKHWIIWGFLGLTALSVILVPIQNNLDFIRHLKFLFFAAILTFIFLETLKTDKERNAGLRIMGIGALIFGLFSVIYNLLGYNVAHDLRLLGPLDAAVYLAFYLTPFFIFFAIQFLEKPKQKSNLIYALILAALILATRSMGAIGGALLIMLIYFFKRSNLKILKSKSAKILVAIVALAIVGTIFYSKILPTLTTEYSSLDERGEIWLTSAEFLKNPDTLFAGLGFGQFQEHYFNNVKDVLGRTPLDYYVLQPHNIFLLFIFQYGILGLAFIVFLIYKVIEKLIGFKKPDLTAIVGFMLLYFLIHGLIDTPFFKNDLLILFLIFGELSLLQSAHQPQ